MKTTQPIRNKEETKKLAMYFQKLKQPRNHVLICFGLHTALRISDILNIRWSDVYDFMRGSFRQEMNLTEKKTDKQKIIALNKNITKALKHYASCIAIEPNRFLIENPRTKQAICREQAYRIIKVAGEALDFKDNISCHSLRKTFGYHAWKSGVSLAVIMEIYNHSSIEITKRYLGVTQDEVNDVYLNLKLYD